MKLIIVKNIDFNTRVDKYLMIELNTTRNKVQNMIKNGNILVNNKVIKSNYILNDNDEISINNKIKEIKIEKEDIELDIVYEDDYLLVVNKPSGMTVHPSLNNYSGTLVNALLNYCSLSDDEIRPGIVHRLDKDTSGLLLVAKDNEIHKYLTNQLKERKVLRKYIALVNGIVKHNNGTIDVPIGRDIIDRKKMSATKINSKDAITHFKVIERYKNTTLIECILETGRTHQIRVHLNYIKHSIVNDPLYGLKKKRDKFGQMLHSSTIGFIHPISNKYLEFTKEPSKEYIDILNKYKTEDI